MGILGFIYLYLGVTLLVCCLLFRLIVNKNKFSEALMDYELNWLGVFIFQLGEFRWLALNITFSLAINSRASPVGVWCTMYFCSWNYFYVGVIRKVRSCFYKKKTITRLRIFGCDTFVLYTLIRLDVMVEILWVFLHDNSSLHAGIVRIFWQKAIIVKDSVNYK